MSSFTYTSGIPATNNDPSVDQPNMAINTNSIASLIAVDHVPFNTPGGGRHDQVTFNDNNVPTVPTTPPVLFTNLVNSLPQLMFYSGDAAHGSSQYVLTANGSTFLLGGIIAKWGTASFSGTSTALTVTFPVAFPNDIFIVVPIAFTSTGIAANVMGLSNQSGISFTVNRAGGSGVVGGMTIYYLALGN